MPDTISPLDRLENALPDTVDVFIASGVDPETYLADLTNDIRRNVCEPFPVTATVVDPGFPDAATGSKISGLCVARKAGYWLVYQPSHDRFCCFWGESQSNLGAPGVFGSPLYCWSA